MKKGIGNIENYYGGLVVKEDKEKFYWGIEDHDGTDFYEIPKYLYDALLKHEKENEVLNEKNRSKK